MSDWVGYAVSVNCGETLGSYQGTILETDGATITLTKAFRNGFPYPKSQVTLNAADIKELRIIEARAQRKDSGAGAGAGAGGGRRARATVCETLQANPTSTGNQAFCNNVNSSSRSPPGRGAGQPAAPSVAARSKPLEIQPSRKANNHAGSYGSGSTPKSRGGGFGARGESTGVPGAPGHERARRRNEACFGDAADPALDDDFDFEGNLALFDKRAVWASLRHAKPDVVRTADESKYRHDENVLGGGGGGGGGGMLVPRALCGAHHYVTDAGARVPSVLPAVRRELWRALRRHGLLDSALTLLARAVCDVALRLVGGGRRLEARNAHQAPSVLAVAGAHGGGACALAAARLLASRGARLQALVLGEAPECAALQRELAALALDGVGVARSAARVSGAGADLVVVGVVDPLGEAPAPGGAELAWLGAARAVVVAVEPAAGAGPDARACVLALTAAALAAARGRVFLADVAAPRALFAAQGLQYRAPFGAAPVLPLHPAPDADADADADAEP